MLRLTLPEASLAPDSTGMCASRCPHENMQDTLVRVLETQTSSEWISILKNNAKRPLNETSPASLEIKTQRRARHRAYRSFRRVIGRNASLTEKVRIANMVKKGLSGPHYFSIIAEKVPSPPTKIVEPQQPRYATQDQIEILQRRVVELSNLVSDLMAEKERTAIFRPCSHREQTADHNETKTCVPPSPSYVHLGETDCNLSLLKSEPRQYVTWRCHSPNHHHDYSSLVARNQPAEICCPSCSKKRANWLYQYDHRLYVWLSKHAKQGHRYEIFWSHYLKNRFPCE